MFAMWFSGLRGGVAFALASVSYAAKDFAASCGGIDPAQAALDPNCTDMTDSLAILQTTLIIASFTIFVFGGAITDLAICLKVLDKGSRLTDSPAHPPTTLRPQHGLVSTAIARFSTMRSPSHVPLSTSTKRRIPH